MAKRRLVKAKRRKYGANSHALRGDGKKLLQMRRERSNRKAS